MAQDGSADERSAVAPAGPTPFPMPVSSGAGASGATAGRGDSSLVTGPAGTPVASTGVDPTGADPTSDAEVEPPAPLKVPHTRTSATYIGVAVGLLLLVVIIIFIAQNLSQASVHFLGFHFRLPEGLIVLAAAVGGGLIVLFVSLARVLQLRLMARRHRRVHTP